MSVMNASEKAVCRVKGKRIKRNTSSQTAVITESEPKLEQRSAGESSHVSNDFRQRTTFASSRFSVKNTQNTTSHKLDLKFSKASIFSPHALPKLKDQSVIRKRGFSRRENVTNLQN